MNQEGPSFEPVPDQALPQWRRLQDELREHWPTPCANDPGFTDDYPSADTLALCAFCPTLDACRAFAEAFEPTAGVWAGERWPRRRARKGEATGRGSGSLRSRHPVDGPECEPHSEPIPTPSRGIPPQSPETL